MRTPQLPQYTKPARYCPGERGPCYALRVALGAWLVSDRIWGEAIGCFLVGFMFTWLGFMVVLIVWACTQDPPRRCPYCDERIRPEARYCRWCDRPLVRRGHRGAAVPPRGSGAAGC